MIRCGHAVAWAVALGASLLPIGVARADTNAVPQVQRHAPITSHLKHFIVTDTPKRDALEISVWAETVRERLADWVGAAPPLERVYPLVIRSAANPEDPDGRVLKAQAFTEDGFLQQEITMVNPAGMDQEDMLEALSWLMLNRWIHVRQDSAKRRSQPGAFPDWFAIGIAQNLYPALRSRNQDELLVRERNGAWHSPLTLVDQVYMSPGRRPEKALAGLVIAWLAESIPPQALVTNAAARIASGGALDEAFLRGLLGLNDNRSVNMAWDLWMARQDRRLVPGLTSSDYTEIGRLLTLPAEEFGVIMPAPGERVTAELLITQRDQEWVRQYSRSLSWRLRRESVGKVPELVAITGEFIAFFDALAAPLESTTAKPQSEKWLRDTWSGATGAWDRFVQRQRERESLLDRHATEPDQAVRDLLDRWEP